MRSVIDRYLSQGGHYDVVDFGSRTSPNQTATHRELLKGHDVTITGLDIKEGNNVDVIMTKPYSIPLKSNSADLIITGQVYEHIPFFWVSFLEMARVVRPRGLIFMTVPSRGHVHDVYDCWRFYPDSMRALAAHAGLELLEATTDMPPTYENKRLNYAAIDEKNAYWGDTVGVFRKPTHYPAKIAIARKVMQWWAHSVGDLSNHPIPKPKA